MDAGTYRQYISQLVQIEGDRATIETPVWALAGGKQVPIVEAYQFQLGTVFRKGGWLIDIQAYLKKTEGITSVTTGFDDEVTSRFNEGDAFAKGIDLLIKKRLDNYQTWIAYSLSEVTYNFPNFFDSSFPGTYDQTHILNWVHNYNLDKIDFSFAWKLSSGRVYSNIDFYELELEQSPDSPDRWDIRPDVRAFNTERLPFVHQLDASFLYHIGVGKKENQELSLGLALSNIYAQDNTVSRNFFIRNPEQEDPRLVYANQVGMGFAINFLVRMSW